MQFPADFVTITEEILNGKLHFLCSGRGDTPVTVAPAMEVSFKNCALFTKWITKIKGTTVNDLDLVMTMYNLTEFSSNYFETTRSLWFYSKDEATNFNAGIANKNYCKSFKYKGKLLGNIVAQLANGILKNATIDVPLKYLCNFWRSL